MKDAPINLKVKRFDKDLPLPARHSSGAVCFDLYARTDVTVPTHGFARIPLNVAIEVPKGYCGLLAARSSTHKLGLLPANGVGVIDEDFCGDNDEIMFLVFNPSDKDIETKRGGRIAQLTVLKNLSAVIEEVPSLKNRDRGGIGSTGN